MVDGLTGLGNHRAFQDELARQLEVSKRSGPSARAAADRRRRPQGRERHEGPRRRRPAARGSRPGDRVGPAAWRPGVPRRWRRVRDPAARVGRGDRPWRSGGGSSPLPLSGGDPTAPDRALLGLDRRVRLSRSPSLSSHDLYRNADAALYWCKRHGRTAVVAFDPELPRRWPPTTDRSRSCPRRSARSSRRGRCGPSTSRSSR